MVACRDLLKASEIFTLKYQLSSQTTVQEMMTQFCLLVTNNYFPSPFKASLMNESEIVSQLDKDENIRYFKLPENNGWNSGRALLISQVQTEYFVWCDDDWIFHDETNLETMLGIRDSRTIVPRKIC